MKFSKEREKKKRGHYGWKECDAIRVFTNLRTQYLNAQPRQRGDFAEFFGFFHLQQESHEIINHRGIFL